MEKMIAEFNKQDKWEQLDEINSKISERINEKIHLTNRRNFLDIAQKIIMFPIAAMALTFGSILFFNFNIAWPFFLMAIGGVALDMIPFSIAINKKDKEIEKVEKFIKLLKDERRTVMDEIDREIVKKYYPNSHSALLDEIVETTAEHNSDFSL